MEANFDFKKTGKRIPYTIPEDFFNEMEDKIWKEVSKESTVDTRRKVSYMRVAIKTVTTIAAIVALLVVFNTHYPKNYAGSILNVELAFSELSNEDQAYLLEVYQDDIFINE